MIDTIMIRKIERAEFDEALSLVWRVFQEYETPDYTHEGINEFYRSIHDEKYLSALCMIGAFIDGRLVGIIATRSEGSHIALFFVGRDFQRQGIGKKLFQRTLSGCPASELTVNSSPFAVPVYHKLGFLDTDKEQTVNGLKFTPMAYKI